MPSEIWIQMAHRFGFADSRSRARIFLEGRGMRHEHPALVVVWIAMILVQIGLGAWTIWWDKAADVATVHMMLGALSLLVGALIAFRLFCGARIRDFVLPDAQMRV